MNKIAMILAALVVASVAVVAIASTADADTLQYDGWTYTVDGDEVTITGYTGLETRLTVPSTIDGKVVTTIGDNAFLRNRSIQTFTAPSTVTNIGSSAFEACTSLLSVTFEGNGLIVGQQAFFNDVSLISVTLPDNMDSISKRAFKGCVNLETVDMPDTIGKIASEAFTNCSSLKSITVPAGANVNTTGVFAGCTSLTDVTIDSKINFLDFASFPGHTFYDSDGNVITDRQLLKGCHFVGEDIAHMEFVPNVTATFMVEGKVYDVFVGSPGATIVLPKDDPVVPGHIFVEWDGYTEGMVLESDVVFNAVFDLNQYTVTFKVDGKSVYSEKLDYGARIYAPEAPLKEGYTFLGWSGYYNGITVSRNMTFNAEYSINVYAVMFTVDGEVYKVNYLKYGAYITLPETPSKEGYTFVGWDGYTEGMRVPAHGVVFESVFDINRYNVSFVVDGSIVSSANFDYGTVIVALGAPAKEGYTFVGWEGYTKGMTVPAEDVRFDAVYTINQYSVSFVADGIIVSSGSFDYGTVIAVPEAPEKEGYTFVGWNGYTEGMTVPAHDVQFDATYQANQYNVRFTAENMPVFDEMVDYGTVIVTPEAPAKEGYTFVGWNGYTEGMTVPAHDVQFDASYTINQYEVRFVADNAVVYDAMQDYGTEIVAPEAPAKEGYTFVSWNGYTEGMTVPANDVTIVAEYDANPHTITFVNGKFATSYIACYDDVIELPPMIPVKASSEGVDYEFVGWEGYTEGMTVSADHVFYAVFEAIVNTHVVKIVYNDGTVEDVKVTDGSVISEPRQVYRYYKDPNMTKVWSSTTKIFHDVTVYAKVSVSGNAGDDASWEIDFSTGTLTISGTGATYDWSSTTTPWYAYRSYVSSLVVEEGITHLGSFACYKYANLTDIVLSDTLASIGKYAVVTSAAEHVYIGEGLKDIGVRGLYGMKFFEGEDVIKATASNLRSKEFYGVDGDLELDNIHGTAGDVEWSIDYLTVTLTISGEGSAGNWTATTAPWYPYRGYFENVVVEDGVTEIGDYSFYAYTTIKSIVLGNDVVRIGQNSLRGCVDLEEIVFGEGLVIIGSNALTGYTFHDSEGKILKVSSKNLAGHTFCGNGDKSFIMVD